MKNRKFFSIVFSIFLVSFTGYSVSIPQSEEDISIEGGIADTASALPPAVYIDSLSGIDSAAAPVVKSHKDSVLDLTRKEFRNVLQYTVSDLRSVPVLDVAGQVAEYTTFAQQRDMLHMVLILQDIYNNRDMEFARGLMLGLDQLLLPENVISLKVINGAIPDDSMHYELDLFEPHLIFTTFEKDIPRALINYAELHDAVLFNVFDAKGDDIIGNHNVWQILSPPQVFNESASNYFIDLFPSDQLIVVGEPDFNDLILRELVLNWPDDNLTMLSRDELTRLKLDETNEYIFYPIAATEKDTKELLADISSVATKYPETKIGVSGRSNWVTFTDQAESFAGLDVFIPTKCYFDTSSAASRKFIKEYSSKFGHSPIRSFPVYAVMGYDIAQYFIPYFVDVRHDLNPVLKPADMLQMRFNMENPGSDMGRYNSGAYMLHYLPEGTLKKETLN